MRLDDSALDPRRPAARNQIRAPCLYSVADDPDTPRSLAIFARIQGPLHLYFPVKSQAQSKLRAFIDFVRERTRKRRGVQ